MINKKVKISNAPDLVRKKDGAIPPGKKNLGKTPIKSRSKPGVNKSLVLSLFKEKIITLSQAAKAAGLSTADFLDLLKENGIDVADYPVQEVDKDLAKISGGAAKEFLNLSRQGDESADEIIDNVR